MGTAQTPPNQILLGIALFLTIFIMAPVFTQVYDDAIAPYSNDEMELEAAIEAAQIPMKDFMLRQTREKDLQTFVSIADNPDITSPMETPLTVLVPAFITSELKSAFTIGFMLYIPFIIIDMVVASVLMSMGMMMLSPMIISLPFKLLLFVMVDGWMLLMTSLTGSYV
jgi:flagellar biosynthetic protein FliP